MVLVYGKDKHVSSAEISVHHAYLFVYKIHKDENDTEDKDKTDDEDKT